MQAPSSQEIFILGVTHAGQPFRPSDWAERLAGVMSPFRPGGAQNRHHPASYSPWCVPTTLNGTKCVVVHLDLRQAEPMAFDFVMNFARDNDLQTLEACLLPTPEAAAPSPQQSQAMTTPTLQLQA
ncbi:MAG: DUF3579 domain-containing protein [Alphaproteobacteria bacterium]|nr:DUF3579 domain-containing protein [Alphaproteobacteria bacterium]